MKKNRIYIAGKVTGENRLDCALKFSHTAGVLRKHDFLPINPLEVVNDFKCPWQKAMRLTIAEMMKADAILMIGNWRNSKGAMMEYAIAKDLEIPVFEDEDFDELLKHFGKFNQNDCEHRRIRTVVLSSNAGCETTQSKCEDCGKVLSLPITEC